ncbi:uncharacterized protein [Physcomitrium patens]|uniref:tRNA pseudouridine(55) synthase n=1 Tax=Physcomitrium patens TaxID=3218 RepID=A0A2K1L2I3_PHYPA|nr:uncharacterized protein LOC112274770 [Physcomitrium patens]PNR60238.1 hypothetical protein PHYPA_003031 [Physcomitrium patens]|eukprot:XP_024360286.1 uncharacterized protein LOC112274770 [Physcomitrella patens]
MSTLLRASPPSSLLHEHFILHYVVRSSSLSSAISPHSLRTISSSSHLSFTNPMPSLSNIRHPRILPISPLFSSPRISCHHKCSSSVGAFGLGGFRSLQSTNSVGQGIQRRAVERDSGDHNAKHMRDVASFDDVDNQISQELEKDAARSELRNAEVRPQTRKSANGILSYKIVSSGSSSDEEDFVERSRNRQRFTSSAVNVENHSTDRNRKVKVNADKKKRSLDVTAIRNVDTHTAPENGEEEIKVFEKWASMKVKEEGSSVEPVIVEMRASLLQRLAGDSQPLTVDGISELQTEFPNARSQSLDLPAEKDPLAFVDPAKRPIVIKRSSKVPEDWDGPGGTVVLIDKPLGWSSFAVCGKLRHMLGIKKVGHAGTLDPLCTGLLIVCVGRATKCADSYQAMTKVYSGTMRFGEATPSLDAGTPVSEELPWEQIQEQDIQSAVEKSFQGDIMQVPPMYSAIKVKGERLYTKARRGEEIVVPPRPVKIYDFQLKRSSKNRQEWDFHIVCSKGTYIRSLCADLARSLNSCAHLTALRREKIGNFSVEDAWPIEELETFYREVLKVPFRSYKKSR